MIHVYIYLAYWGAKEILLNPPSMHFVIDFFFVLRQQIQKNYVFASATEKSHMPPVPCAIFRIRSGCSLGHQASSIIYKQAYYNNVIEEKYESRFPSC